MNVSVSEALIYRALGLFLQNVALPGTGVQQGQTNRIPEPGVENYVLMIPLRRERLETNVDQFADRAYVGSISAAVLAVTRVLAGSVTLGDQPSANMALAAGTIVGAQISGIPGGIGSYNVAPAQNVAAGTIFQAGGGAYLQPTKVTMQLEVHGELSADNAQIISTMFRDEYAVDFFAGLEGTGGLVVPLYADDPRQLPFNNDQQQVENRWVIEAQLQVNATVLAPQQFADNVDVGLINVDVEYPPN